MPYENEHSARLKNPKDCNPDTFRRTNGGTIYGTKKVPKTIAIIWAKLRGKSKPSDNPIPQALRFPVKNWTAAAAKAWLKKNNVKFLIFEPAKKAGLASAPLKACIFNEKQGDSFANVETDSNKFKIVGYSGGIIKDHWFWGNLAIDLAGLKFAKKRLPVLEAHLTTNRIGFTTKQKIDGDVTVEGEYLENANAQSIKDDIQKGFPMEASLFCPPSVIENVREGASVEVNGHRLKGPGAVFRQAVVKEVSMCVFGADNRSRSSAYSDLEESEIEFMLMEKQIMAPETTEITDVKSLAEVYPALCDEMIENSVTSALEAGRKEVRASFASLREACGDDAELLVQCFGENKTTAEARQLRVDKLSAEKAKLQEQVTKLQKEKPVTPAVQQFTDGAAPPGGEDKSEGDKLTENWEQEFASFSELEKAEFGGNIKAYIAFKQAEAEGRVRIAHQS